MTRRKPTKINDLLVAYYVQTQLSKASSISRIAQGHRDLDRTKARKQLPRSLHHPAARISVLPAVKESPSLPAMGSEAWRLAVAAADTTRPTSAKETHCLKVRPQRPGCENTRYHRRASRTAASPWPPLTELASRASPSFGLPQCTAAPSGDLSQSFVPIRQRGRSKVG